MHIPVAISRIRERGDTLVEVLIAIAIVSLILGGAYATTNRSLQATRAAQERSVALKFAEGQIEQIKGIVTDPGRSSTIMGGTAPTQFCLSSAGAVLSDNPTNAACNFNATGGAPSAGQVSFHIHVVRATNTFTLTETWTNVSGRNTERLQLIYRVYQ